MTVTPTGSPIWTRAAGFANYGGHLNKRNHLSVGVVDPETDVSAQQLSRLATDLASIARVAPFGYFIVQCNDSSPAAPTVTLANMATGVRTSSYEGDAPPSGFPTLTRLSSGRFRIIFGSSYSDDFSVSGSFIVQPGTGNNITASGGFVTIQRNSDTQLYVQALDSSGSAQSNALVSFSVYSGGA